MSVELKGLYNSLIADIQIIKVDFVDKVRSKEGEEDDEFGEEQGEMSTDEYNMWFKKKMETDSGKLQLILEQCKGIQELAQDQQSMLGT